MENAAMSNRIESARKRHEKQGPLCIWHGIRFGAWMRLLLFDRPQLGWCRLGTTLSVTAFSLSNSFWAAVERLVFGPFVRRVEIDKPPIFIIGHWRSGTTLVHNILSQDPQFNYPTTYQCLFPSHFLLTEALVTKATGSLVPKKRPMDNVEAGWELPQEDEIALCILSLCSPYRLLVHQGDRPAYERYFDLKGVSERELAHWKRAFRRFLKKLTWRDGRPILLKSPSHSYRVRMLLEMFPGARFIYLMRDPYAVFDSSMHLRRVLYEQNGLAAPNFDGLKHCVFRTFEHLFETYEAEKSAIPPGQLCEVRFEELERDPIAEVERVYRELGLEGFETFRPRLVEYVHSLRGYHKNPHELDPGLMGEIYARWRAAFERYGYPSRLAGEGMGCGEWGEKQFTPHSTLHTLHPAPHTPHPAHNADR